MDTTKYLIGRGQQIEDLRFYASGGGSAASGYPLTNALDPHLGLYAKLLTSAPGQFAVEARLGTPILGRSLGGPPSNAPVAACSGVCTSQDGAFAFVVENGTLRVFERNPSNGKIGSRLGTRSGSTITSVNAVDVATKDLAPDGSARRTSYVAIAGTRSSGPGFEVYPFYHDTKDWGARYANAASTTSQDGLCIAWQRPEFVTNTASALIFGHASSPRATMHGFSPTTGIADKDADPATTINGQVNAVAFVTVNSSIFIVLGLNVSPYLNCYALSSGWGAKHANPTALAGPVRALSFWPFYALVNVTWTTVFIAAAHDNSPFFSVLPLTSSAWGTKLANPPSLPAANGQGIQFSPTGAVLVVSSDAAAGLHAYEFNTGGGGSIGTRWPYFTPPAAAGGRAIDLSPDGDYLLTCHSTTPFFWTQPLAEADVSGEIDVLLLPLSSLSASADVLIELTNDPAFGSFFYSVQHDAYLGVASEAAFSSYPRFAKVLLPARQTAKYARLWFLDTPPDQTLRINHIAAYPAFQSSYQVPPPAGGSVDSLTEMSQGVLGREHYNPGAKLPGLPLRLQYLTQAEYHATIHPMWMEAPEGRAFVCERPGDALDTFHRAAWGRVEFIDEPRYERGRWHASIFVRNAA